LFSSVLPSIISVLPSFLLSFIVHGPSCGVCGH
jgi:hypothetical protein